MAITSRRRFLQTTLATTAAMAVSARSSQATSANDEISVGFISCGGRAMGLMGSFDKIDGVNIEALCDPDERRIARAAERFPKAKKFTDLRDLIADSNIDVVVVATCNHWHCLASIWAMEAGKDVYVEKPLSHSQWEGRQTVAAARKYGRICQIGTQQRSDPMQTAIKQFLHEEKALGAIQSARVNRYGVRGAIGKRTEPLQIEKSVAYDLWLGPAQDEPIYRDKLHYDWHWDWNTGSGEMGNWGVHVLDDLRNNVFQDKVTLPRRIMGGGGRVVWNDAGDSPNVHFAYFDTGGIPVVIGLSNLPAAPNAKRGPEHPGPGSGYIAYCEGGRLEGQRGRAAAYDQDGRQIKTFPSGGGPSHQENFIEAVRRRDRSIQNAEIAVGNDSTGWCNLANIAFRAGSKFRYEDAQQRGKHIEPWGGIVSEMDKHFHAYGISMEGGEVVLSEMLELDPRTEQFVGSNAAVGNKFLKREYRDGYEVPELAELLSAS